jgi:hypothetical protein
MFELFSAFVILFAFVLGLAMLMAYPTMWTVNYLFAAQLLTIVFGVAKISFWKALVLNVFFGIAFKSTISSKD